MIIADTDFFLALLKESDGLAKAAARLLARYQKDLAVTGSVMTELLLLASRFGLDPVALTFAALGIAELYDGDAHRFVMTAHLMKEEKVGVFDALHGACCKLDEAAIISSDRVFDRLGVQRIDLSARTDSNER